MTKESTSVSSHLNIDKCSLVLVDVAGTTTSIDFVKKTLFPYVLTNAESFLKAHWEDEAVKQSIEKIKEDNDLDVAGAVERVKSLTEQESSNEGLKSLQGLIYKEGYEKGDLKAHVFDDVAEAFESWANSRKVAIYSTGSIESQKLLFSHTTSGDLSGHIFKYFDQTIGTKTDSESYKKIVEEAQVAKEEVVFITDDSKEAAAAKASGLTSILIKREGNADIEEEVSKEFSVIASFNDLPLDKSVKRKIDEEIPEVEAPPSKVAKTEESTENAEVTATKENSTTTEPEKKEDCSMEVDAPTDETKTAIDETENIDKTPEKTDQTTSKETKGSEDNKMETDTSTKSTEHGTDTVEAESAADKEAMESREDTTSRCAEDSAANKSVQDASTEKSSTTTEAVQETVCEGAKESTEAAKESTEATKESPEAAKESPDPAKESPETAKESSETAKESTQATKESESTTEATKEVIPPVKSTVEESARKPSDETEPCEKQTAVEAAAAENTEKLAETADTDAKTTSEDVEEPKKETETEKVEKVAEKSEENGDVKPDEKENNSVLANGVENGDKNENESVEKSEIKSEEIKMKDETELKVKKLEESAESKTVSVEV